MCLSGIKGITHFLFSWSAVLFYGESTTYGNKRLSNFNPWTIVRCLTSSALVINTTRLMSRQVSYSNLWPNLVGRSTRDASWGASLLKIWATNTSTNRQLNDISGFSTWVQKNPYSRCHDVMKKKFYIWQYRSAMNSSELPYYYHIFLVFQHKKLTFSLFWGYWWHHFTKGNGWKHQKSELKGKNPSGSMKILMLSGIRPFILTQAENPNSKD